MTFPQFAHIPASPGRVPSLIAYLNACGWEGDDAYETNQQGVGVRLVDEGDVLHFELAMTTLNSFNGSYPLGAAVPVELIAEAFNNAILN